MSAAFSNVEPVPPNDAEAALAQEAICALSRLVAHNRTVCVETVEAEGGHKETVVLQAAAVRLLHHEGQQLLQSGRYAALVALRRPLYAIEVAGQGGIGAVDVSDDHRPSGICRLEMIGGK